MPPVLVVLATIGWALAASASVTAAIVIGAVAVVSVVAMAATIGYMMSSMGGDMPSMPGFSSEVRERTQVVRSAVAPHRVVYGECLVSGPLIFACSSGDKNEYLWLVVVLACHEVESIGDVYLSDKLSNNPKYGSNVTIWKYLGTPGQTANADLISASKGQWSSSHTVSGRAYIIVRLHYNNDSFPNGIPNVKAVVKGKKVYDPRNGQRYWSNNWALCVLDYLLSSYGLNCSIDEIDVPKAIAAANISDESIVSGWQNLKRYTADGTVDLSQTPVEIMKKLLTAGAGSVVWSQGKYHIHPACYTYPVMTLTESDLKGDLEVQTGISRKDKFNTVRGTFVNKEDYWQQTDFPVVKDSADVISDGGELVQNIELQFTTNSSTAMRLANIHLLRSKLGITVTFPAKFTAFALQPKDNVRLTIPRLGWYDKLFSVTSWTLCETGGVDLLLREESDLSYYWDVSQEIIKLPTPDMLLPDPWYVDTPYPINYAEELYYSQDQRIPKSKLNLSWATPSAEIRQYEIERYIVATEVWISEGQTASTDFTVYDIARGNYQFRVRSVNGLGVKSQWTVIAVVIYGKTTNPSEVTNFIASVNKDTVNLTWNHIDDFDRRGYIIKVGETWDNSTLIKYDESGNSLTWKPNISGDAKFLIKALDTSGNASTIATTSNVITVGAPFFVEGSILASQIVDNNVLLRWPDASSTFPISKYEIRKGVDYNTADIIGYTKSTFSSIFELNQGQYKYWVTGVDTNNVSGETLSTYATVSEPLDFIFYGKKLLNGSGTLVNTIFINDSFVYPVNNTETFQQHFVNNGWSSPSDQINAGSTLYIQPGLTTGSYSEILDFEATIPSTRITLDLTKTMLSGTVVITPTISTSLNGTDWTDYAGVYTVYATNFRYVKVLLEFVADYNEINIITKAAVSLDSKVKTKQYTVTCVSTDIGGTSVDITGDFIDIQTLSVSPLSTNPVLAVYDLLDTPNPTEFKILLFDLNGNRLSGTATVAIRGV